MKEIKFRAWVQFDSKKWGMLDNENLQEWSLKDLTEKDDTVKLMQFTGLHDKNGVEVYTGDILQFADINNLPFDADEYINKLPNAYGRGSVYWYEGRYWLDLGKFFFRESCSWGEVLSFDADTWIGKQVVSTKDLVVIGNIYENPELCKK